MSVSSLMPKRRLSFTFFSMALFFLIATGSCSSVFDSNDCDYGDDYCGADGVAHVCRSLPTTLSRRGWLLTQCRDANHCRVDEQGAFCTLAEQADERCVLHDVKPPIWGGYCDGNTSVSCRSGFPISKALCARCSTKGDCSPMHRRECDEKTPCPEGLVCDSDYRTGKCIVRCDCEEGIACKECDILGGEATSGWMCIRGACESRWYGGPAAR